MDENAILDRVDKRIREVEAANTNVLLETENYRLVKKSNHKGGGRYFLYLKDKDTFGNDFWKPLHEVDVRMQRFMEEFIEGVDNAGAIH